MPSWFSPAAMNNSGAVLYLLYHSSVAPLVSTVFGSMPACSDASSAATSSLRWHALHTAFRSALVGVQYGVAKRMMQAIAFAVLITSLRAA